MRLLLLPAFLLTLATIAAACGGTSEVATNEQPPQSTGASEVATPEQPTQPAGPSGGDASKPPVLPRDLFLTFEGTRYEAIDLVPILGPPVDRMTRVGVAELVDADSQGEIKVYRRLGEPGPAIYTETFDPTEMPGGEDSIGRAQLWIRWIPAE